MTTSNVALAIQRSAFADMWRADAECMNQSTKRAKITKKDDSLLLVWSNIDWWTDINSQYKFEYLLRSIDVKTYFFIRLDVANQVPNVWHDCRGMYYSNPFNICVTTSMSYDAGEPVNIDLFR